MGLSTWWRAWARRSHWRVALTHAEVAKSLRLAHAITIDSSQSKTLTGRIRVLETGHRHMTRERLLVAVSRATSSQLLALL